MTVTAVLLNFRAALFSLVSFAERVGIGWRRPDAYDEWDTIASTIFEKLVVEVLRWSLSDDMQKGFCLPRYDLLLPTYEGLGTLEVIHSSLPSGRWLFHAFGTKHTPFDVVEVRSLSNGGRPLLDALDTCPVEGTRFLLRPEPDADLVEEIGLPEGAHEGASYPFSEPRS